MNFFKIEGGDARLDTALGHGGRDVWGRSAFEAGDAIKIVAVRAGGNEQRQRTERHKVASCAVSHGRTGHDDLSFLHRRRRIWRDGCAPYEQTVDPQLASIAMIRPCGRHPAAATRCSTFCTTRSWPLVDPKIACAQRPDGDG